MSDLTFLWSRGLGNITIKLGYANAKIYKKKEPDEDVPALDAAVVALLLGLRNKQINTDRWQIDIKHHQIYDKQTVRLNRWCFTIK